jgi:hypothetical protein
MENKRRGEGREENEGKLREEGHGFVYIRLG